MLSTRLDYLFPFLVFSYGILVVFVLETYQLKVAGQKRNQQAYRDLYQQLAVHKPLAWICFWVGGFWTLQNLLFS
jgi:hypothetical protein